MDYVFDNFKETIERAIENKDFPELSKVALFGRISYAVQRGDITLRQAEQLFELMDNTIQQRYRRELEIADFGDSEVEALSA